MSKANDVTLSLKVMINKQKTKVLFAEADSDFTDILLSFLTLPLGKIAKVLDDHYGNDTTPVGSLTNLYKSLANIDSRHFVNEDAKKMLLSPRSSVEDVLRDLKLDICNTQPTQYFTCEECNSTEKRSENICVNYGTASCDECGGILGKEIRVSDGKGGDGGRGFALKSATFMISNDLHVVPSAKPFLQTLTDFGIIEEIDAVQMNVALGVKEIVGLLKFSLLSKNPLTDLVLNTFTPMSSRSDTRKSQPKIPSHGIENTDSKNPKNISLRVTVQKSTNKLLFAQAEADFVELLFSFLTIPLGGVESLLANDTCLKNIDNLYKSVADDIGDKYFTNPETKNRLMHPKLALCYTSKSQFLPLFEESAPSFYFESKLYYNQVENSLLVPFFKSPKGPGNYVKEPSTYLVTDDLKVTSGMTTALTILKDIPLSDVEERVVKIGLEEALRILKASLTSKFALSSGLKITRKSTKTGK